MYNSDARVVHIESLGVCFKKHATKLRLAGNKDGIIRGVSVCGN